MCGIFVYHILDYSTEKNTIQVTNDLSSDILFFNASLMNYRGNTTNICKTPYTYMFHRRLAINDLTINGKQPFHYKGIYCLINGEILNHKYLKSLLILDTENHYMFHSKSDCEVVIPLYLKYGTKFINKLIGMFSGVIYDSNKNKLIAFRDPYGITSLYYGLTKNNNIVFSSDLKCLNNICEDARQFPPGKLYNTYLSHNDYDNKKNDSVIDYISSKFISYNDSKWNYGNYIPSKEFNLEILKNLIIESVVTNVNEADANVGFLLSGGVDSSLVMAIAARHTKKPIHTFTIGFKGSPDVKAAESIIDHYKSKGIEIYHKSYIISIEEAISSLPDVINAIETYDLTTVRASIPMYLLMKRIKSFTNIKVILSGEGADELFSGYAYNRHAPDKKELHLESIDKIKKLYLYDNLRSHKCGLSNTIEIRPPFLYKPLVDYVLDIDPHFRHPKSFSNPFTNTEYCEKYILRKCFDENEFYLPNSILWREKEQFSDGVSSYTSKYNLIDSIKNYANLAISDLEFETKNLKFLYNTPLTKEQYLYRNIFSKIFPKMQKVAEVNNKSIACSTERAIRWMNITDENKIDPSGRI